MKKLIPWIQKANASAIKPPLRQFCVVAIGLKKRLLYTAYNCKISRQFVLYQEVWIKGDFQMSSISIWFILSKCRAEMHISYTRLYILHCFSYSILERFPSYTFFHIMNKNSLCFANFKKVMSIRNSTVCILSTNNLNFEKNQLFIIFNMKLYKWRDLAVSRL